MADDDIGGIVTYVVKVKGSAIADTIQLYALHVEQRVNRISTATITILDGNPTTENFSVSASDTFIPGNEISIEAGYNSKNTLIFSGIITRQSIRIGANTGPMLEVECKDKAIKMTVGRKNTASGKIKDSDAMKKLISNAGLSAEVSSTITELPELVQYYCSDWDFLLSRAEINSMLASTINGKVRVFNPTKDTSVVATLSYGDNLFSFNADLNSVTQLPEVKASAWDYQNQKLVSAQAPNNLAGPGNLSSKKLSEVIGLSDFNLQTTAAADTDQLSTWAKAQMLKSELSKIIGQGRIQGNAKVLPGSYVTIDGLGPRFDGDHFIQGITHDISEGNWFSDVAVGLPVNWFVQDHELEAPQAAGLLPGIGGLYNATVKKMYEDPDSQYRILVDVALFNDAGEGLWARLANFYSTNGQGAFFLPEVGDEVILGFLNQDPRYPVILGSMYSSKNKPYSDFSPNEKNSIKGIVSKSELRVMFDDENKVLTLITPNKNTAVLSDKDEKIELKDQNGNSIIMSSSGIEIKSSKTITLTAAEKVNITGNTGVSASASGGDVSLKGMNIKATADMQFSAKANVSAEVQASAQLTLKGGIVMIN
ncbi:MAG: type IV secretion protein Rhs [Alteromonadaceae bacterium]|nr:MAG: type IV secretion protein Rhs [Alteromonadaceae bacterium]